MKAVEIIVAAVLLGTAAIKGASAFEASRVSSSLDPLLSFVSSRVVLAGAAAFEVVVAAFIVLSRRPLFRASVVLGTGMVFVAYHLGLYLIGYEGTCPCMGNLYRWLGVPEAFVTLVSEILACAMLVCGLAAFLKCKR